ncbi:MAG TPA: respiratory nitrate reductase subunit gamma [Conexivisphaerales archaeon]|nr:respiratory nitrate reductase subunit gamma [Conexivisphaerales archaeon]
MSDERIGERGGEGGLTTPVDFFIFEVLPYLAIAVAVVASVYRYYTDRFSISSDSSQLLESRQLRWGSVSWHYAIIVVLGVHIVTSLLPAYVSSVIADATGFHLSQLTAWALAIVVLAGLAVLISRRLVNSRVAAATIPMDWVLLASLMLQVGLGAYLAFFDRGAAQWFLQIVVPWLQSLLSFNPNIQAVSYLPLAAKVHVLNALVLVMLIPFTKLIHMFTLPVTYLWRPYQLAIWNRSKRGVVEGGEAEALAARRRNFLRVSAAAAITLVAGALVVILKLSPPPPSTTPPPSSTTTTTTAPTFPRTKVTNVSSLVAGQSMVFNYPLTGEPNLLVKLGQKAEGGVGPDGDIVAFSRFCQHLGCAIGFQASGSPPPCNSSYVPQGPVGYCCCHNSVFDFANGGKVLQGPSPLPVPQVKLEVDSSGDIYAVGMGPPTIYNHNTGSTDVSADLQG